MLGCICGSHVAAQQVQRANPLSSVSDATVTDTTVSDGPYVSWVGDSSVRVRLVCHDSARVVTIRARHQKADVPLGCTSEAATVQVTLAPATVPAIVPHATRIFAISDLEGEYAHATQLLRAAKVLDQQNHWAWGTGHLVLAGDLVDRGTQVTEVLWLIYRLEQEAARAGGAVHYILGNHDAMLLYGDHRYVASKYATVQRRLGASLDELYGPTTVLGQWMRSRPAVVRIDSVLFLHGGIGPTFAAKAAAHGLDLVAINAIVDTTLYHPDRRKSDSIASVVLGPDGPLWYRGYLGMDARTGEAAPATSPDTIAQILARYGAAVAIVGHTDVDRIAWHDDGRVIGLDVTFHPKDTDHSIEHIAGLLIEQGHFYRVDLHGRRTPLTPVPTASQ